ncbi:MAG: DMT family transporter [Candidatus Micrarchaeota archaeon]
MDLGILFGLLAALGWALSDIVGSRVTRRLGPATTLLFSAASGVFFYFVAFAFFPPALPSAGVLQLILVSLAFFTAANVAYFLALSKGDVSVVSPITASFAVPVVAISVLFFHESLSALQFLLIGVVIAGTILISFKWSELSKRLSSNKPVAGAKMALASALAYGVAYSLLKPISVSVGPAGAYFFLLLGGIPAYYLFWRSRRRQEPKASSLLPALLMSLLFSVANLSYAYGLRLSLASLVTAVSACHPFVVAVLARSLYRERLEANQYIGIFLVVAGVIGLSL